ncbi:hypothetical protein O7599_26840 [Streptomyces sp. WMMC500]|nr:hypothetical protein [Streptomyces sp. WMMC500]WBB59176.1 hypothetical protein O7599_26840 [Streptomyces sp. WMMC500]
MNTPQRTLRLLPWVNELGRPCYAEDGGSVSQYADFVEHQQLDTGSDVLRMSNDVLTEKASETELRFVALRLSECLRDALRVAESRGERLSTLSEERDDEKQRPTKRQRAWPRRVRTALKIRRP